MLTALVGAGCADVGELFALERVHFQVVFAAVFADDHALVHLLLCSNHQVTALFQVEQSVRHTDTVFHRDQHTSASARN